MMDETKRFALADVLSISTGRLVSPRHVGAVYEILNWMTNDNPSTHQLGRASDECTPWLLRWFPELAKVDTAHLDALLPSGDPPQEQLHKDLRQRKIELACIDWVEGEHKACGLQAEYDVPRIPRDDHDYKDPYDELVAMRGTDEDIILVTPNEKEDEHDG